MTFDWDEAKAAANFAKHRVAFDEAKTVFDDPLYIDFYDPEHSADEPRYIIMGNVATRPVVDCVLHREEWRDSLD